MMRDKQDDKAIDKNFFKAMNYELAGEIGVIDNEEMKNNMKLVDEDNLTKQDKKSN